MSVVVFCEDQELIVKLIRVAMRSTAHVVHVASSGSEGLALIERLVPDLVFTDIAMPDLDGYALIAALKERPAVANVRVIVMSASVQRAQQDEAFRRGAAGFLAKPFGPAELRRRVDEELLAIPPKDASVHVG